MVEFETFKGCVDGRCASTILRIITLCSRSRCGAREAMTVGCKPTRDVFGLPSYLVKGSAYGLGLGCSNQSPSRAPRAATRGA